MRKIWEFKTKCPQCGEEITVENYLYDAPLIGKLLISVSKCDGCGYRHNDVRAVESKGPHRLTLKVDGLKDLNILVVRSSSASIRMPELGVEITPGPAAKGFISTVEGILDKVLEVLSIMKDDPEVDERALKEKEEKINKAKEGKIAFTLIIEDPTGASRIISDKAKEEKLYRPEIA
ncbi:MAG: hypothetical protein DRN49_03205 [Thaumarchaeota archaeon]|nr:MAG: hypothetical protein DRN49_03205 [Nitrososphaerota archaeon]